jgi:hypothetical protein
MLPPCIMDVMKRTDWIPALIASLAAMLGGGLIFSGHRGGRKNSFGKLSDGSWLIVVLLLVAGISLVVFLTYAFTFVYSANIAVI